jgi:hypothetical protein
MIEVLDRREIPMQPIRERGDYIDPVVPVHLEIAALDDAIKIGGLDVAAAIKTVTQSYNEDMTSYLGYLGGQGYDLAHLKGFEEFNPDWILDAVPSYTGTGFLDLTWSIDGQLHILRHDSIPVPYQNRKDENGNFYTPKIWEQMSIFPIVYRSVIDPIFLFMEPEKMKQYGVESPELNGIIIDPVGGISEVIGTSFNSDVYLDNLAKALVMRNYGVAYMNQLATNL